MSRQSPTGRTATTPRHLLDDCGDASLEVLLAAAVLGGLSASVCYMLRRSSEPALRMSTLVLAAVLGGLAAVLLCGYVCIKIADARPVRRETGE